MKFRNQNFFSAVWSLLSGLGVTFRSIFRPTVTVKYPHEPVPVSPVFRGPVRLLTNETGDHKCVGCLACQRICPTNAIPVLTVTKNEANKTVPVDFVIDDALCCYCGLCVEVCPTVALEHSHVSDMVSSQASPLRRTILQDQMLTKENDPVSKPELQRK